MRYSFLEQNYNFKTNQFKIEPKIYLFKIYSHFKLNIKFFL